MVILGLDYGEKRMGVALSDELHFLAHQSGFIECRNEAYVTEELNRLITTHDVQRVVVGMPLTLKGEHGPQAESVSQFVNQLKRACACEIVTWDERLTTAQAEKELIARDMSRAKRRLKRDAIAAEIMLQSYLDCHQNKDG